MTNATQAERETIYRAMFKSPDGWWYVLPGTEAETEEGSRELLAKYGTGPALPGAETTIRAFKVARQSDAGRFVRACGQW